MPNRADNNPGAIMEKKLKEFLSQALIYLVTDNKLDRMSWKKAFVGFGVRPEQIVFFERFDRAMQAVQERPPMVLITAYEIKEEKAYSLLEGFREARPNSAESLSLVVTELETQLLRLSQFELELDGVLIKPYNAQELDQKLTAILTKKSLLSADERKIGRALEALARGELDKVESFLGAASSKMEDLISFKILKGRYLRKNNMGKDAISVYEEATLGGDNYQAFAGLFDLLVEENMHQRAFEAASDLIAAFSLHPNRISNYAKICILTSHYHSFVEFAQKASEEGISEQELAWQLAAGLAICAKSIGIADKKVAVQASVKAVRLGKEKRQIVEQALKNLLDLGEHKLVEDLIRDLGEIEDLEDTIAVAEYRVLEANGGAPFLVFQKGMELTNKGVHDFHVYELLLKSAKQAGRKADFMEEMLDTASKHYPEKREYLKSLIA